jgi:hypothetical protein
MNCKKIALIVGTTVAIATINFKASSAFASTKTAVAGMGVTATAAVASSASAATIIGAPAAGGIALAGGGTELVLHICAWFFDPPDPINAGVPVSLDTYSWYKLPDVFSAFPGVSLSLGNKLNNYYDLLDSYLANMRAAQASLDRYEGALSIGQFDWAADRFAEKNSFLASAASVGNQIRTTMPYILSEVNSINPEFLKLPVTLSDAIAIKNAESNGNFSEIEQKAIDAWALTPEEINSIKQSAGSISDTDIQNYFKETNPIDGGNSITLEQGFKGGANACETCPTPVPEPSTIAGLALGLGGLRIFRRRQKQGLSRS